ncbi:MAG: AAA family ATPase [Candidatus Binataceae bacterium]
MPRPVKSRNQAAPPALSLIDAMKQPEFYPVRPAAVELRQTHLSYVFLAGDYVYKIKKAVRFPFVDCSSLQKRRVLCHEELRLNRRLAPDTYLAVIPIIRTRNGFALDESGTVDAAPVEFAVKMRRLPDDRMLEQLVRAGLASVADLRAIARRLVAFHAEAAAALGVKYGSPAAAWKMVAGNLEECERFVGFTCEAADLTLLSNRNREFVAAHWKMMARRAREGCVREGHGDLRCEHVCMIDGTILVFDCVEFSEALRYADVACDLGFLAMDLDRLGASELSRELVGAYATGHDDELRRMLPFYKCYRAAVRAKVESIRALEREVPAAEREQARAAARQYFALARAYACQSGNKYALVICGLSGTGKSTLAAALSRRLALPVISSDRIRKILPSSESPEIGAYGRGLYSEDFNRRTYDAMLAQARRRLTEGDSVILDATFRNKAERRAVTELATSIGARILFVECRAEEREIIRRLDERERRGGELSDANAAVYLRQRHDFESFDELTPDSRVTVETTEIEAAALTVERALERPTESFPGG